MPAAKGTRATPATDAPTPPTLPIATYPIGAPFDKTYTQYGSGPELISPGNLAGWPALALPNGFGDQGLPTSVALMGPPFTETRLTAIGKRHEFQTYRDAQHAFFNDHRPEVYDAAAAKDAWARTLAFFRRELDAPRQG